MQTPIEKEVALKLVEHSLRTHQYKVAQGRAKRSTYTEKNALEFQRFFDDAIDNMKDVCIPYTEYYTNTPSTLYRKILDGLKWLMENGEEESQKRYRIYRARVKCSFSDNATEGIWLRQFAMSQGNVTKTNVTHAATWKDAFTNWLEQGAVGIFDMNGLNLSVDDKTMVETIIDECNKTRDPSNRMVCRVTLESIRVIP